MAGQRELAPPSKFSNEGGLSNNVFNKAVSSFTAPQTAGSVANLVMRRVRKYLAVERSISQTESTSVRCAPSLLLLIEMVHQNHFTNEIQLSSSARGLANNASVAML